MFQMRRYLNINNILSCSVQMNCKLSVSKLTLITELCFTLAKKLFYKSIQLG